MANEPAMISAESLLLDVLSDFPQTEQIIRSYDKIAGGCICCEMLFESVATIAQTYNLDLGSLLKRLNEAVR